MRTSEQRIEEYVHALSIPDNINFDNYFTVEDKAKIKEASYWREELKQHYLNPQSAKGLKLPWNKATDFRIRRGESTIHTGYNGHRKSMMLGMIKLAMIAQGEKCLSISLEMKPRVTLDRMLKQFTGRDPSLPMHDEYFNYLHNNLFLYNQLGTVKWKRVIAVARYAIKELGVTQVFLDSLMKFGIKSKDHETQAEFVDEMTTLGKDTDAHFHLVAHSVKAAEHNEHKPPSKAAVAGSADLTNMVDNVVIHFQNKKEVRNYDQLFIVEKQRNPEGNDAEPSYMFNFDDDSLQFKKDRYSPNYNPEDWRTSSWI